GLSPELPRKFISCGSITCSRAATASSIRSSTFRVECRAISASRSVGVTDRVRRQHHAAGNDRDGKEIGDGAKFENETQGVRGSTPKTAGWSLHAAGVGEANGTSRHRRVRRTRRRGQGRHYQSPHGKGQPARLSRGSTARADGAREVANVHAALHAP